MRGIIGVLGMILAPSVAVAESTAPVAPLKVIQFVDLRGEAPWVLVEGGRNRELEVGMVLKAQRLARDIGDIWVTTGAVKLVEVADTRSVGQVVGTGTGLAQALFRNFAGVMSGDSLMASAPRVHRRIVATPTHEILFASLFVDPKIDPQSLELSAQGRHLLDGFAAEYAHLHLGRLLIQGFTDPEGPADRNQIESYQRALTVRQYLIDYHGFDPDRVLAVGMGEGEPTGPAHVPGVAARNRRITLSVLPNGEAGE